MLAKQPASNEPCRVDELTAAWRNKPPGCIQTADDILIQIQWHQRGNCDCISLFRVTIAGTVFLPSPFWQDAKNLQWKLFAFFSQSHTLVTEALCGNFDVFADVNNFMSQSRTFSLSFLRVVLRANLPPAGDPWCWITWKRFLLLF